MKKVFLVLSALIFGFILTACGRGVSQEDYDNLRTEFEALQEVYDALRTEFEALQANSVSQETYDNLRLEFENLLSEFDSMTTPAGPTEVEVFVHEDEYVIINFIGTEVSRNRESLVFLVDNLTDVELTFQSSSLSIDGVSLGHISGSDSIAAQSSGRVRFRSREDFPTLSPETISGNISVIDFSRTLLERSYDIDFVNLEIE